MNRLLSSAAFAAGLAALGFIAATAVGRQPFALVVTALIALLYGVGALELRRFARDTQALAAAVDAPADPAPALDAWLAAVPEPLRASVRLRIEGGAAALPGPAMAPYLAGLFVLLGMLGTFVGMVVTLRGTGVALETAADVAGIRASLVAPVQGLGLAFGTSVAGVAASAALGLMSALARRERLAVSARLDAAIAGPLRVHSRMHQRDAALALLQRQADALPALAATLQAAMADMARQQRDSAEQLRLGLADGLREAGQALQPAVDRALAGVAREATAVQQALAQAAQQQAAGFGDGLRSQAAALLADQAAALQRHADDAARQAAQRDAQLAAVVAQATQAAASHTSAHMQQTLAEVQRLLAAAAQAPQAAADVIGELRQRLSDSLARDNAALAERERLLQTTATLLAAIDRAAGEQRAAGDALASSAAQVAAGGAEVASLGEAFEGAVMQFGEHSQRVVEQMQRIESALAAQLARSDDQLAYYVAQARELLDLSVASQKRVLDELQHLQRRPAAPVAEAA